MRLRDLNKMNCILVLTCLVIPAAFSGCGLTARHRHEELQKACHQQVFGVEDEVCHGYCPTSWRSWNCNQLPVHQPPAMAYPPAVPDLSEVEY